MEFKDIKNFGTTATAGKYEDNIDFGRLHQVIQMLSGIKFLHRNFIRKQIRDMKSSPV